MMKGDVQKFLACFSSELIRIPFVLYGDNEDINDDDSEMQVIPLVNLSSGLTLPNDVAKSLLDTKNAGKQ